MGFFGILKGLFLKPVASSAVANKGELEVLDSTSKLQFHNGTTASPVVTEGHAATLTNKTISGSFNTVTNVPAANVVNTPSGNVTSTDVQAAINEVQTHLNTTNSTASAHTGASSGVHGVTGSVVGTTDTQTLTNKSLVDASTNFVEISDPTKKAMFSLSNLNTATTATMTINESFGTPSYPGNLAGFYEAINADMISNVGVVTSVGAGALTINIKDAQASSTHSASNPGYVTFRSQNANTGATLRTAFTASPTITIPSGASIGVNTTGKIYLYLVGQSITQVRLAVSATPTLREDILQSGTAISGASSSSTALYCTNAFTNEAVRLIGYITANNNGSGVWSSVSSVSTGGNVGVAVLQDGVITLTNKNLSDSTTSIVDVSDATKKILFDAGGTTSTSTTITGAQTSNRIITLPDATTTLVGTDATQSLSNKTFSDAVTLTQISTPSNPSAGTNKVYTKTDGNVYVLSPAGVETQVGSGSGSGINYILNPGAETDTSGWATYADSPANVPVDGTSGTATNLTFSRSTSSPLRTTASFLLSQANSTSLQGKGVSYDFTIDSADKAKVMSVSFDYNASSTFVAADGITAPRNDGTTTTNAGNSDIEVFLYDITNSVLLNVSPQVIASKGSNNYSFKGTFQTSSNSTSYRLIFHVATTSANVTGWSFKFDNVSVGPQAIAQGTPMSDWASYTPTFGSGFGTPTNVAMAWSRAGDSILISGTFTTGTIAASLASISLPSGLSIDTSKVSIGNTTSNPGYQAGRIDQVNANTFGTLVTATATDATKIYVGAVVNQAASLTPLATASTYYSSTAVTSVSFSVPISGWSSAVLMSNDTDTRVVAAKANSSTTAINSTSDVVVINPTKEFDTHGAYNTSTGVFTVPVSGFYDVSAQIFNSLGTNPGGTQIGFNMYARKNGVKISELGSFQYQVNADQNTNINGITTIQCVAGDTLDVVAFKNNGALATLTLAGTSSSNWVLFKRVSGPSAIATTDSINARYYASATSISGSLATISWTTKDFDTHNAMSSGSYTVPANGKYQVNVGLLITGTIALNNNMIVEIQKNGTVVSRFTEYFAATLTDGKASLSDIINCVAGDVIRIQASSSVTSPSIVSSNFDNYVSLTRVGN